MPAAGVDPAAAKRPAHERKIERAEVAREKAEQMWLKAEEKATQARLALSQAEAKLQELRDQVPWLGYKPPTPLPQSQPVEDFYAGLEVLNGATATESVAESDVEGTQPALDI